MTSSYRHVKWQGQIYLFRGYIEISKSVVV